MFGCNRRHFLKRMGGFGFLLGIHSVWALEDAHSRLSPQGVKGRIRGPILTVPTPFTASFKVDYQGVRNMVRLGLENGIGVYELTAGNSQYNVLGYNEIKKLTRVL